mmetsp:Transcript_6945/g.7766  ORF Transcript_6945/g.7766 Transcript_6945/m.7766 type:complete len:234 (+) Transcript_6945:28-729(+)|eukprot:CAMPEP_0205823566 /NCGR_PEP_ID=MMETSP0206-20130828/17310_1 /ASSEMBLY_ACC=CAM_ASM_000279 /TAXON_ID=36767 /ORGANISM="Euplotes focardii, Strain TN1" /LENGTH=233 /DNA_ID=CAMNT_0053120893 /DNA_START=28 /DNA_END=729 /DNA_ORIENTATION=+
MKRKASAATPTVSKKAKAAEEVKEGGYAQPRDQATPNLAFVTKPAPWFSGTALLPDGSFDTIKLSDYAGKYLVLFSYPLDWTFVCPTEICAFSDRAADFKKLNAEIVGFSVDSEFSHLAWTESSRKAGGLGGLLNFPLLADKTHQVSRDYGCLNLSEGDNFRGLFIIDPKGVVRHITMNDPCVGRNPDEVLRLIAAYQFADEHGEVCPVNWQPGKPTIKNDPKGKLAYFAASS